MNDLLVSAIRSLRLLKQKRDLDIERAKFDFQRRSEALYRKTRREVEEYYESAIRGLDKMAEMEPEEIVFAALSDPDVAAALAYRSYYREDDRETLERELEALEREAGESLPRHEVRTPRLLTKHNLPIGVSTKQALKDLLPSIAEPGEVFDSGDANRAFRKHYPGTVRSGLSSRLGGALKILVDEGILELVEASGALNKPNRYRLSDSKGPDSEQVVVGERKEVKEG